MFVTDESGLGLQGSLDGHNRTFTTSRIMRTDLPVEVVLNGARMFAGLDDGFVVQDARTVVMKLPPVALDTLAVKFSADALPAGLPQGTPQMLQPTVLSAVAVTATVMPEAGPLVIDVTPR